MHNWRYALRWPRSYLISFVIFDFLKPIIITKEAILQRCTWDEYNMTELLVYSDCFDREINCEMCFEAT